MINKRYKIRLDIVNKFPTDRLNFSLSDVNSSVINIEVSNRDKVVDLTNTIVVIGVTDPSNRVGIDVVKVDQAKDGLVSYVIKPEFKNAVGKWQARLMLILGDDKVVTNTFSYEVKPDEFITINEQASIDERFPLLTDMLSRLSEIEATELDRVEAEKLREENSKKAITELNDIAKNFDTTVFEKVDAKVDEIIEPTLNEKLPSIVSNKIESIKGELKGDKGEKGDKGDKGDIGPRGETGPAGPQGERGIQGEIGQKGETGTTGPKGEKGERGEQGLPGNDGRDGITPNITIGTVTTLEPNQQATVTRRGTDTEPILDFGIPRGENGSDGGNANIDDTQVSTDTTWSSDKISTWNMEQDGVFWTEKEDNFISADDTYEYKLREVEIFGDTWQDSDSKNLCPNDWYAVNDTQIECSSNIYLKENTDYFLKCSDTTYKFQLRYFDTGGNQVGIAYPVGNIKFTTISDSFAYCKLRTYSGFNDLNIKVQIEEGTVATDYVDYHKADLSNIQHAGELYVDELGQPILDSEGREQYKIEIEICNGGSIQNISGYTSYENGYYKKLGANKSNGIVILDKSLPNTKYTIKFTMRKSYSGTQFCKLYEVKDNNILNEIDIMSPISNGEWQGTIEKTFTTSNNTCNLILGINTSNALDMEIKDDINLSLGDTIIDINKSHKQTILLPCQLMKVGDVKDRLFWDESKGRYVVEKNVIHEVLDDIGWFKYSNSNSNGVHGYYKTNKNGGIFKRNGGISSHLNVVLNDTFPGNVSENAKADTIFIGGTSEAYFKIGTTIEDLSNFKKYIKELNSIVYFINKTPQIIETNITTPITIPTYNNKTHVYVVNSNNAKASIKAKFPLKTASAVATLNIENDKNSKDIQTIEELNVDMIATNFDMDYRLLEVEWALEDAGIIGINSINILNINRKGEKTMALSRYEQAKIMILGGAYDKATLTKQLTRYLEKKIITQTEYDDLIALMEAKELVVGE